MDRADFERSYGQPVSVQITTRKQGKKMNRPTRRWKREMDAVKAKFGGSIADDQKGITIMVPNYVSRGQPLPLTVTCKDWPFRPPPVAITGISISYLRYSQWNPNVSLLDYVTLLLDDLRSVIDDPEFLTGSNYDGTAFRLTREMCVNPKHVCPRCKAAVSK